MSIESPPSNLAPIALGGSVGVRNSGELSGQQKVAIVLAQLPTVVAAAILKELSDDEAVSITTEIAKLPPITPELVAEIVGEFVQRIQANRAIAGGGLSRARVILAEAIGQDRAEEVLAQLHGSAAVGPLAFLAQADPAHVVPFLVDEHPQTIAVVLAHLPPSQAAQIMNALPANFRNEVVLRIATMDRVPPEAIGHAAGQLASKLRGLISTGSSAHGGIPSLVEILNQTDGSTEKQVLADLAAANPAIADAVKAKMFTFEDVMGLDDKTLQLVFRSVTVNDLALAVKGSDDDDSVLDKLRRNLSERAVKELDEELEVMGPVRISMVDAAQGNIVRVVRELEANGTIVVRRGEEELVG